jgi:hypothetical protein
VGDRAETAASRFWFRRAEVESPAARRGHAEGAIGHFRPSDTPRAPTHLPVTAAQGIVARRASGQLEKPETASPISLAPMIRNSTVMITVL